MGESLVVFRVLTNMKEVTMEKKPVSVKNVGKPIVLQLYFKYMKDSALEKKPYKCQQGGKAFSCLSSLQCIE